MNFLPGSQHGRIDHLVAYQVEGGLHQYGFAVNAEQKSICELLQPIEDALHTRDRKRSPPDSACMRGTRLEVVQKVDAWATSSILVDGEPHIFWMHGYVGCGKSAISQEICQKSEFQGRPVASFFFFRNAGDRSRIWRLATTLANQMAAAVPGTAPFVRAAMPASPGLKNFPVPVTSVAMQMQRLVYGPFKSAADRGPIGSLAGRPFLIVIDGLDECQDKEEVEELIDSMLAFFDENPIIPLRIFITSRVEQHIKSRLNAPGVRMDNLVDHCSGDDIMAFLDVLFQDASRRNPVIQSYVRERGEWPTPSDKRKLVEHIGGSFIFASAVFKFIMGSNNANNGPTNPMDRLPLALKMNPGLDGLYAHTLACSKHFPHFLEIISSIALLEAPLSTSGIAELLGINTYKVISVLVELQAIIQVPGTDDIPVTLCHTSLRDFLTTQSRSGYFFAHPRHHVRLHLRFLECELELRRRRPGVAIRLSECTPAIAYSRQYSVEHLNKGHQLFELSEFDCAIRLCREALGLHPGSPELVHALAEVLHCRALHTMSPTDPDLKEAIHLYHKALLLRPSSHPDRSVSLNGLGSVLLDHHRHTGATVDLEEAISMYREALKLRPFPHPNRPQSLNNLSISLADRYRRTAHMADLREAILLDREALELRPNPHPDRSRSLHNLAVSLAELYEHTNAVGDLEEAISLYREALERRPSPHPDRLTTLDCLSLSLVNRYRRTRTPADLDEAISLDRESLDLRPSPHPSRSMSLNNLAVSLTYRYRRTKAMADLEEAISLHREALELRPLPHSYHSQSLNSLAISLLCQYRHTKALADLEEAISRDREGLGLRPRSHPNCSDSLWNLSLSLWYMYEATDILSDLQESIAHCEELLGFHYLVGNKDRVEALYHLARLLQKRFDATGQQKDLARIDPLKDEASRLLESTSPT